MALPIVDVTKPAGSDGKKFGDDAIREFKTQVRDILTALSGYPNHETYKTGKWTTATRPTTNLVDGLTGFNETTGGDEHWDASSQSWVSHGVDVAAAVDAIIPIGMISLWSGSVATIPSRWHLCDGTDGTPNLVDKFVVGAGDTYDVADTGGEATHVLSVDEMPKHIHTTYGARSNDGTNSNLIGNAYYASSYTGFTSRFDTTEAGEDAAHNNLPPYYALAYIMRVS